MSDCDQPPSRSPSAASANPEHNPPVITGPLHEGVPSLQDLLSQLTIEYGEELVQFHITQNETWLSAAQSEFLSCPVSQWQEFARTRVADAHSQGLGPMSWQLRADGHLAEEGKASLNYPTGISAKARYWVELLTELTERVANPDECGECKRNQR